MTFDLKVVSSKKVLHQGSNKVDQDSHPYGYNCCQGLPDRDQIALDGCELIRMVVVIRLAIRMTCIIIRMIIKMVKV